jgi:carbamate kinase
MLVVAALGGNALLRRGERADAETQRRNVAVAVDALAEIATEHRLVVTHGNGPQVGRSRPRPTRRCTRTRSTFLAPSPKG